MADVLIVQNWKGGTFYAVATYNGATFRVIAFFERHSLARKFSDDHNTRVHDRPAGKSAEPLRVVIEIPKPLFDARMAA